MAQHLNLYDDRLRPHAVPLSAVQAAAGVAAVLLATFAGSQALAGRAAGAAERAGALEQRVVAVAASADAGAGPALPATSAGASPTVRSAELTADIERLRRFDAAQRRVQAVLEADTAHGGGNYADYFDALARQARAPLWITGLTVSADGDAIELEGRMLDPDALPEYLHRLNNEPRFKGRPFARLSLSALEAPADAAASRPFLEFALRSTAGSAP